MMYHFDFLPTKFELATHNNNWDIAIFVQSSLSHFLLVALLSSPATLTENIKGFDQLENVRHSILQNISATW